MSDTVYADPGYRDLDVGTIMREGHPDIAEGDEHIVSAVRKLRADLGRPLRVLDVGSGSGDLSLMLARALPDCEVIANEIAPNPLAQARAKLAGRPRARVFDRPFEEWDEPVEVVVSWGSHHHLAHDYLRHVRRVLTPDGVLVIGDEFCPEYLTAEDRERLARAEEVLLVDGYVFDSAAAAEAYRASGEVPEWSLRLERDRRRALWTWYKFVGDHAAARGAWPVLIAELAIARDDLVTGNAEEHKTSPLLLERELALNGFAVHDKTVIGDRDPALQSFVVYTCRAGA
ncbi:class I SAM-dependent methyltransferase [Bailinhaonella thermotolerans]|uniref:Class I SAM-dependent methyltransferase n=1 Tax=Bailinhaonella thermotolerans TaxID=1070861 RepID=A0A3A4AJE7_9ACTN|nr:class I SAM-dependent methyltransferase [Bailinhaonella thermotolerans]RJL27204.1 class I SAM-dependent methyltransferase [Bailinhaonella thermotolerans]